MLVAASLPIAVIHQIYFMQTAPFMSEVLGLPDSRIGPAMSIGQFAEIAVMVATGWLLARLGFRGVIVIGAFAYCARYAIFGSDFLPVEVIVASQALHGLCYACFFAAAFIYVDRIAEPDVRHSAQTVFGIVILGLGPVLAAPVLQVLSEAFTNDAGVLDYSALWYSLSALALVTMLGFGALFRDQTSQTPTP